MKILSIETSCDETAVAILEASGSVEQVRFTVLGNALYSQAKKHAVFGGVYPSLAKREHAANLVPLLDTALNEAKLFTKTEATLLQEQKDYLQKLFSREEELYRAIIPALENTQKPAVDAIAVTQGPGLEPALWVGINFARALAYVWDLPIIPVNHLEGHIVASAVNTENKKEEQCVIENIDFPVLGLILSGGHTEFVHAKEWGAYEVVGSTRDDSIGEAFDKVARMLDLPYPGGPEISRLAHTGRQTLHTRPAHYMKDIQKLPRPMLHSGDLDFSFSGLKTAALYQIQKLGTLTKIQKTLFAAEFEEAVTEVVLGKTKQALTAYPSKTFIIGGGVSANKYIRTRLEQFFTETMPDITLRLPAPDLSTDNAVMIGMAGYFMHLRDAPTQSATEDLVASGNMKMS